MDAASGGGWLQSPPCKVLSGQLRLGVRRDGQPSGWLLERAGGGRAPLDVSVVWMQGTVLEVRPEHNTSLQLLDEAGTFTVVGAAAVPQGRPCTSPAAPDLLNISSTFCLCYLLVYLRKLAGFMCAWRSILLPTGLLHCWLL
ncbi:recQ-mediated genome instability protein 2 [Pristis pectinata]|uniref:recQ-mediated genome instability protein 2 n=1 Tax=Pristis pectinata TaxID=685728 RepID=UPI00223E1EE5|nr:recQ-mediated genome instability protein 2 [Pristis pectinata]